MKNNMNEDIKRVIKRLIDKVEPKQVILFGSYAWGSPTADSDIDLFVIKESDKSNLALMQEARQAVYGNGYATDIIVYTPEQVARRKKIGDPFIHKILTQGKIVYEQRQSA